MLPPLAAVKVAVPALVVSLSATKAETLVAFAVAPEVTTRSSPVARSVTVSVPASTLNLSLPALPVKLSLPAPPVIMSLPPFPAIISAPLPPFKVSTAASPVIVKASV